MSKGGERRAQPCTRKDIAIAAGILLAGVIAGVLLDVTVLHYFLRGEGY